MVLIKDENLPPTRWAMAREKHQGDDGITKVVTVKTKNNIMKRPIVKLSKLPCEALESENESSQTTQSNKNQIMRRKNKFMTIALGIMRFVSGTHQQTVKFEPFSHKPGIYFKQREQTFLSHAEWNIVTFYNLNPYKNEMTSINDALNKTHTIRKAKEVMTNTLYKAV